MTTKTKPILAQLIDPNMIAKVIRKHFGVQLKPIDRLTYGKPYPKWVDYMMSLSKGYKVLTFTTFLGNDDKSTMKHVSQFTA